MRFRSIAVVTLLSCAAVGTARAQTVDPVCASAGQTQDVCQQTVDLLSYMIPQLGISITGGNTTLAQGGALGGLPHFTIGVRANLVSGALPEIQTPTAGAATQHGTASSPYPVSKQFIGLPAIDGSVGLFKGVPLGLTNVAGVDLILSLAYVPSIDASASGGSAVKIAPKTNTQLGYGVRIGLLQESLVVPGVSFSYLKRDLPTTTITGSFTTVTDKDTLILKDMSLKTNSWRLTASKSLILFGIAAGLGGDSYDVSSGIHAALHRTVPPVNPTPVDVTFKRTMSRMNYFADLSMNILLLKIVGEVGMVQGGTMKTFNTFEKAADDSRMYGSLGLRLGF